MCDLKGDKMTKTDKQIEICFNSLEKLLNFRNYGY